LHKKNKKKDWGFTGNTVWWDEIAADQAFGTLIGALVFFEGYGS